MSTVTICKQAMAVSTFGVYECFVQEGAKIYAAVGAFAGSRGVKKLHSISLGFVSIECRTPFARKTRL